MGLTFRGMLSVGLLVSAVAVPPARQTSKSRRGPLDTGREYCLVGRRPGRGRTTMTTCGLVDAPATGHQASARCVTSLRAADHTSRMPSTVACGRNRQPIEDTISDHMLHAAPSLPTPGSVSFQTCIRPLVPVLTVPPSKSATACVPCASVPAGCGHELSSWYAARSGPPYQRRATNRSDMDRAGVVRHTGTLLAAASRAALNMHPCICMLGVC
jgi:hypothetical protein